MIKSKELYNLTGEQVMALPEGTIFKETFIKGQKWCNRRLEKRENCVYIVEDGEDDFYSNNDDNNYKLTYYHIIAYYFDDFKKVEKYDYRWESYDKDANDGYDAPYEEDNEKFFFGSIYQDFNRDEGYDYKKEEDVDSVNDMWEIIRDEFINPYYDEYKLSLYDEDLDKLAWENGL